MTEQGEPSEAGTGDLAVHRGRMDAAARKCIKISLPLRHHLRLTAGRVLRSEGISETVERALDAHFARLETERAERRGPLPDEGAFLG